MRSATNEAVVLAAALELRADQASVDVEDIAVAADARAPGRFRWRKYTQHINIQTVGKVLRDAKQRGLVRGTSARGWMLTDAGIEAARQIDAETAAAQRAPVSRHERAWAAKERARLIEEPAYAKAASGQPDLVTDREAMRFFRVDDYVVGDQRQDRVDRLRRLFQHDEKLGHIVGMIAARISV